MKHSTLVVISGDPRTSARPAEAIRIAAGVGTWKKTEVSLLLSGVAPYLLAEEVDDLIDEDNFTRYLPIIEEWGRPIFVLNDFAEKEILENSPWSTQLISLEEAAALYLAQNDFIQM